MCPSNYIFNDRVDFDRVTDKNVFLTYAKDENVQFTSSSGGTVRTIAKEFVRQDKSFIYSLYEQDNILKPFYALELFLSLRLRIITN